MKNKIILAIETSCDDTCAAVLINNKILSNYKYNQESEHSNYGGVYPKLAAKLHNEKIIMVIKKAIQIANISINDITDICYTSSPGMRPSLLVGKVVALTLGKILNVNVYPQNHLIGHLLSPFYNNSIKTPTIGLVISGGHTNLYLIKNNIITELGQTLDDAIGEAFDKIGRELKLNYPGGIALDQNALKNTNKNLINFSVFNKRDEISFSFSGLKSQIKQYIEKNEYDINHLSESILFSGFSQLYENIIKAMNKEKDINSIIFSGGVSASKYLRKFFINKKSKNNFNIDIYYPLNELCTDNAAMIGFLMYNKNKYVK